MFYIIIIIIIIIIISIWRATLGTKYEHAVRLTEAGAEVADLALSAFTAGYPPEEHGPTILWKPGDPVKNIFKQILHYSFSFQ